LEDEFVIKNRFVGWGIASGVTGNASKAREFISSVPGNEVLVTEIGFSATDCLF
jgi:hypothetical protein